MQKQPDILRTTTTAAVHDPITKKHLLQIQEQLAARPTPQQQQQQRQQQQDGSSSSGIHLATKATKNLLEEPSLILSAAFLGNVAAQYQPPVAPPFMPVVVQKRKKRNKNKNKQKKTEEDDAASGTASGDGSGAESAPETTTTTDENVGVKLPPAITASNLPSLDVAAPARNLCIELLSTRVVACVRAVSLLLQEFSSSPGQSLPHVAVLGSGNVGHTILSHLVKLLPPDRIVILARDSKAEVCTQFSQRYGVRSLSTNILRDERLVDVIRKHRDAAKTAAADRAEKEKVASLISKGGNSGALGALAASASSAGGGGGGGGAAASHVSPEVAAANNISVALQQVHVLILTCRPAQLPEVAHLLQPWLRSNSVVIVSTLVGVTADRIAGLFRVPSSLSVTVDAGEMLFAFESASLLQHRQVDNAIAAAATTASALSPPVSPGAGVGNVMSASASAAASLDQSLNWSLVSNSVNAGEPHAANKHQKLQLRFFTHEPLDFIHRVFFALVMTLLERCGVGPVDAWRGVAKLLLGRPVQSHPTGIAAHGPLLISKCSAQTLANAAGLTVGEVMSIVDSRMARFAGIS